MSSNRDVTPRLPRGRQSFAGSSTSYLGSASTENHWQRWSVANAVTAERVSLPLFWNGDCLARPWKSYTESGQFLKAMNSRRVKKSLPRKKVLGRLLVSRNHMLSLRALTGDELFRHQAA